MKTTFLCAAAVLAAVLLVSATVWEGVTDVAFVKDLPRAYSIATNSFPRNTMVDVTNLENGKMVRVIVISGLETTGLLATLSRAAADAIDLRHDSTCRIRMTQTQSNASQHARAGNAPPVLQLGPIDSSGEALAAENAPPAGRTPATESVPVASRTTVTESAPVASRTPVTESAPVIESEPVIESAPVTSSAPAASRTTVTESAPVASRTPVTESAPVMSSAPAASRTTVTESAPVTENVTPAARPTLSIIAAEPTVVTENDVIAMDEPSTIDNVIAEYDVIAEPAVTYNVIAESESTVTDNVAVVSEPIVTDNAVAESVPAETAAEIKPEPRVASGTLTLVPANERLPPAAQGQTATAPRSAAPRAAAPEIPVSRTTVPQDAPSFVTQPAETPAAHAAPAEFSPFQAPLINSLAPGKWYVQIGVYSHPDNVEEEISRIGTSYPVAVQNIGTDASPMFRVLLGPLNQGESGAMLQRFKSIGYADAFVRQN